MMNDWQRRVTDFACRRDLLHDPVTHALGLASEVGELAKEVLLATDYGRRAAQFRPDLAGELGHALYGLLALAEACGVDAEDALGEALEKHELRVAQCATPGSE